ncbi:hypothetical protein CDL12_19368 [Handroanthus impetiginosus]|uniref:Rhodanese domain-containing protein n=1 Tax=Handroanthus impetiginosus TaxID=429701 RepID=A0A2G9GS35_9LAMI|nr:hypothetical protein CDL12_19368 [Handroanthus impetiginosus]
MLLVSSATTSCSCNIQIPIHGGLKSYSSYWKAFDSNCNNVGKVVRNFSNSSKRRPVTCFYSNYVGNDEKCISIDMINQSMYQNGCSSQGGFVDESHRLGTNIMVFVDNSSEPAGDEQLTDFIGRTVENTDTGFSPSADSVPMDPPSVSESFDVDVNSLSGQKTNVSDVVAQMNDSIANTISGGENILNKSLDTITSTLNNALTDANEAIDNVINDINSFINKSGESAGNKLIGFSGELTKGSGRAGAVALDVLRQTIVTVEDFLVSGAKNVGYAYDYAKEFLPQELRDALSLSEESVVKVLTPVGTALQQVYVALKGFEENLGLDPNDPLVPFVLFLGVSATLWGSYRVIKYSGYAGDLSPKSAVELLRGNKNVVLIDIRPENLRERDGIPDLRRSARFRYASVTPLEVDGSVKKQLKGGRDIEDLLLAAVIRNLKVVEDRSKVLVMDADGTRSKSVARSLRKLGIKRPYQVQGGFGSWLKEGIRVKELKPETTLTILNEEAEAILEEIKPTPLKLIGFGVGIAAAAYSLLEWEKTLQFIGVIGIGQTIYWRVTSYQDAEDLKQDMSSLLAPVSLVGQVISWAAGKLEPNRNGLPTLPSSSDVQSRVLQAAAKHESQPTDGEETQDLPVSGNEEVNASEA